MYARWSHFDSDRVDLYRRAANVRLLVSLESSVGARDRDGVHSTEELVPQEEQSRRFGNKPRRTSEGKRAFVHYRTITGFVDRALRLVLLLFIGKLLRSGGTITVVSVDFPRVRLL